VKVDVVKIPAPNVSQVTAPAPKRNASVPAAPLTNGYASIYQKSQHEPEIVQASFGKPQPIFATHVAVDVAVPQKLVEQWSRRNGALNMPRSKFSNANLDVAFEQVRGEIVNRVMPLLPMTASMAHGQSPVSVRLVRPQVQMPLTWMEQLKPFLTKYWPSIAVLAIGVLLIGSMTRNDRRRQLMMEDAQDSGAD
jgi:hypothetical protein